MVRGVVAHGPAPVVTGGLVAGVVTGPADDRPPHERILAAARDLFCRDGIAATGIDRVLARAGASKMTLYTRFGSKEALLQEVLRIEGEDWRRSFFADLGAPGAPPNRLRLVVPALRRWFDGGRFYGCAFMNAAAERTKAIDIAEDDWLRTLTREHHAAVLAEFARLAREARLPGPDAVARQVLLVMDGTITALMVSGNPLVLDTAETVVGAVLAQADQAAALEPATA